jgi:cytochrome P450
VAPGGALLGSLPAVKRDFLGFSEQAYAACGDVARVVVGPPGLRLEFLIVSHPDGVARVLAGSSWTNFRKEGGLYDEIRSLLGDGILTSQDEDWTRQRRFVQPLFTHAHVEGYATAMVEEIGHVLDGWRVRDEPVVDLHEELTRLTLRVVARVLFGDDAGSAIDVIRRDFPIVGDAVKQRGISPLKIPLSWPTPLNRRALTAQAGLYGICDEIVAHRRSGRSVGTGDLLDLLLAARDGGEALTDDELCGVHVPAGTLVTLAPWVIHRRADLWPDPLRYDPERFVPPLPRDRHRYAWMPFGGGPRGCIGQHFSVIESVLALALVVRDFTLEALAPTDHLRVDSAITIRPLDPVLCRLAAR